MNKGQFITVEGTDGSGKTTQFELMSKHLISKGLNVVALREPGGTRIGERIRSIILDPGTPEMDDKAELLLYTASRAQLVSERIKSELKSGKTVLCDRFVDSNVAYQGYGRGLPIDLIYKINEFATEGLVPDLTIFLDLNPEIALKRIGRSADRLENEKLDFHKRVYEGYCRISEENVGRVVRINCNRGIDEIFEDIRRVLDDRILNTRGLSL